MYLKNKDIAFSVPSMYASYIGTINNDMMLLQFHDSYGTQIAVSEEFLSDNFEIVE
jgi:uncharacterized protein YccT (UPF0319 family)